MSTVSSKDKNMLLVAVVAVLYAFAALSFKKQSQNWKASERIYQNATKKLREEAALIAAKDDWTMRYEQMRDLMPVFPYEKDVDTHWLSIMDAAASRNGLMIARRQASKEVEVGDVYELPIDCKDWEGTLESLDPGPRTTIIIHDAPYDIAFGLDNMFKRRMRQWTTQSGRPIPHRDEWMRFCTWVQERQFNLEVECLR